VTTTVLGRPVRGEITEGSGPRADQWPDEKFVEYLDAVLDIPGVEGVRWRQYTPYFNDGEPCIFGLHGIGVKVTGGEGDSGDYDDGYVDEWSMKDYSGGYGDKATIKPLYAQVFEPLRALEEAFPHFEDFLERSFGDHAIVTATKEGFDVEFYDHD